MIFHTCMAPNFNIPANELSKLTTAMHNLTTASSVSKEFISSSLQGSVLIPFAVHK